LVAIAEENRRSGDDHGNREDPPSAEHDTDGFGNVKSRFVQRLLTSIV